MFVNVSATIRAGLVKQLVDSGCDSTVAHEAVDLAGHAIDTAIEAVKTVTQRASCPQAMMIAHPLALQLLEVAAKGHAELAVEAARVAAQALGMEVIFVGSWEES